MNISLKKEVKCFISHKTSLCISGIIGAVVYILLFGIDTLVFTNVDWIFNSHNDINQHYLGWVYYRNSDWSFPIGVFSGLTGEARSSMVYTDSIPLLAICFKLFSSILPEHFQYFGIFTFLSVVLQAVLGNEIIYKMTGKIGESIVASFFFLCATVMGQRMFEHTSLTFHAIILVAIILFLTNESEQPHIYFKWNLLLVFATLIHAYYVPMVLCFELFYYLKEKVIKDWYVLVIKLIGSMGITVFMMYIIGYFYGANYSSEQEWLWQFGTSVNAFFTSQGRSFSSMILGKYNNVWEIEEGYAYLGMGMILINIVAAVICIKSLRKESIDKKKLVIIILGCVFVVVSMIPTLRWNWDYVITIPIPSFVKRILGVFRSNGRFIWPAFYLVIAFAIAIVVNKMPRKSMFIICICVIIQFLDLLPFYEQMSSRVKERLNSKYEIEMIAEIPSDIESVMLMGEINSEDISGFDFYQSMTIGNFAGERHIRLSDFYIARKDENNIADKRNEAWRELLLGEARANTLYVFPTLPYDILTCQNDLYYYSMDNMIVALDSPIRGIEKIDIKDGINIIEVNGYVDVDLSTMEGVVMNPMKGASISFGHCLYQELLLNTGKYEIEIKGQNLNGLGMSLMGDGVEFELNKENEGSIMIYFENNQRQVIYIQLLNENSENIDINGLTIRR